MCEVKIGDKLRFAVGLAVLEGTYQELEVVSLVGMKVGLKCLETGHVCNMNLDNFKHDLKCGIIKREDTA